MATINLPQVPFTLQGNTTGQKAYVDMVNALLRGLYIMNMQVLCSMQQQQPNKLLDYQMLDKHYII
ncbi:hypothetical protein [Spiroplasma endosymbiont of Polydrusus formosus]|uniref:hypothetical protein n=1 Tax=Spiroplasma endosymbiont of Polydrusus formosus TaxID=3139326 RepID=UPI0035B564B2